MKNVILFIVIFLVFGGLMKAPVYRMCETSIVIKYYSGGKMVFEEENDHYTSVIGMRKMYCTTLGKIIPCDSIIYEPRYTTYRMLDN